MELFIDSLPSPIGEVRLISDGTHLRDVDFDDYDERMQALLLKHYGPVKLVSKKNPGDASSRLSAYFDGELDAISALKVMSNGSDFQQQVWQMLCAIPVGETWSYGQLAKAIGNPKASRAVGLANGSNPIAIVVPCHRVIGANGTLTGYGGGLSRKRWLLAHEGAIPQQQFSLT